MAENAVLFSSYKTATAVMGQRGVADGRFRSAMAGVSSGIAVAFVLTPVELVKCKLQVRCVVCPFKHVAMTQELAGPNSSWARPSL